MATITFYIRSTVEKLAPVYIRYTDGRTINIRISTPYKMDGEYWDVKKQKLSDKVLDTEVFTRNDAQEITFKFSQLKDYILRESFKLTNPVTSAWLQTTIDNFYHKDDAKGEVTTLNKFISKFITEIESGDRLYEHNNRIERYKPLTVKNYKGFQTQFDEYQKAKGKVNFADVTSDFYDKFVLFFNKKSYSPNTIGRHIKSLKVIMRVALNEGLHTNQEINRKNFKVIKTKVANIYLGEKELQAMYNLNLSETPILELTRDVFLIGCYTAQRFSDYSKIQPANVRKLESGVQVIDLIQQKTGERCIIPIRYELDQILKKYNYRVPKTHEQKINKRIKDIGKKAGITEMIMTEEIRGGLKVKKQTPKHDLIKTHTCRRSGCTNMYLAGIKSIDIMKISGHQSEREFLAYIKTGKEETADSLSSHPYFIGNPLSIAK